MFRKNKSIKTKEKLQKHEKINKTELILEIIQMHRKMSISKKGTKSVFYRIVMPPSVLKRLGLPYAGYIAFKKKGDDVQLVRILSSTEKIQNFMGVKKILSRNRLCLPKTVVTFLNIADNDYLKFIEVKKDDIRLRKLPVGHHYYI